MKNIILSLKELFNPKELQRIDSNELLDALNDASIRKHWLMDIYEELKRLNLQIDNRLLTDNNFRITDLSARRRAYQDMLEAILSTKRLIRSHNPKDRSGFDLDAVTASQFTKRP